MAIFAQPANTQTNLTLMGQVLPDPIKNKVGFRFKIKIKIIIIINKIKKPEAGPGRVQVLVKT